MSAAHLPTDVTELNNIFLHVMEEILNMNIIIKIIIIKIVLVSEIYLNIQINTTKHASYYIALLKFKAFHAPALK